MTQLDPSVYKKRNKLLRDSTTLQAILLDAELEFDRFYRMKMQQDYFYRKWLFYDRIIKEVNKKEPKE